jgi:hypothetical protein
MDNIFGFLVGIGVMIFLISVGNGINNWLSNKHKIKSDG